MNNPYLLKKQIQENEEELSKYLRDMNIWQEQMKRKDSSPPRKIAEKPKKPKNNTSTKPALNKISSWDYSAWDKFDVDKACEDLDVQNKLKKNDSDEHIHRVVQSKQSEGIYEKNLGNALVQKQKWAEAILRYTRAIEYYSKDPVFFANRALCYLKTNEFKQAITDCDSSIELDKSYVKAYQRRSAAHMALGMYNKAQNDLIQVLKLEPNNKQAKLDMEVVNNKITLVSAPKSDIKLPKSCPTTKLQDIGSNMLCEDIEVPKQNVTPKWPSRIGCKQITSKQKPPHLRSKKPFFTPTIQNNQVDQEEFDNFQLLQTTLKEVCGQNKKEDEIQNKKLVIIEDVLHTEKKNPLIVPPPPLTYVQLKRDWEYLQKDSKQLFHYLKQIPGKRLPSIVRNSMDNDLFVGILNILKSEFVQNGHEVIDYLIGISELPRLQMLVMFCSDAEVLCIKDLLSHVSKSTPEKIFKKLKNSFGV